MIIPESVYEAAGEAMQRGSGLRGCLAFAIAEYERLKGAVTSGRYPSDQAKLDAAWASSAEQRARAEKAEADLAAARAECEKFHEAAKKELYERRAELSRIPENLVMATDEITELKERIADMVGKCREACGTSAPSGGHDYVDEVCGLLRVTRGQRDSAWKEEAAAQATIAGQGERHVALCKMLCLAENTLTRAGWVRWRGWVEAAGADSVYRHAISVLRQGDGDV